MKCASNVVSAIGPTLLSMLMLSQTAAMANPVWHCSRSDVQMANASDDFTLATLSFDREVIRVALRDLYTAYNNTPVRMSGGAVLSACLLNTASNLTTSALASIGAPRPSYPTSSHIRIVNDESGMLACISKHHPAIGYLPKAMQTESIGPCF